jgi:hypothetical protein
MSNAADEKIAENFGAFGACSPLILSGAGAASYTPSVARARLETLVAHCNFGATVLSLLKDMGLMAYFFSPDFVNPKAVKIANTRFYQYNE